MDDTKVCEVCGDTLKTTQYARAEGAPASATLVCRNDPACSAAEKDTMPRDHSIDYKGYRVSIASSPIGEDMMQFRWEVMRMENGNWFGIYAENVNIPIQSMDKSVEMVQNLAMKYVDSL